jgi:hypothetical protein
MNKLLFYTFFAGIAIFSLTSCEKNNLVIGKQVIPPAYVKFNTVTASDTIGTYYIKSTNAPFKIPIGVTNVSDKDRTINFSYSSSTAVQGQQYTAPASIVIPAGQALDSLAISGISAGFDVPGRIDTLKIAITGGDVPASPYKQNYTLYLRKYCDVVLDNLLGDYTRSKDQQGSGTPTDAYTATIKSYTSTGPTSASIVVYNFGDPMFGAPYNDDDLAVNPGITLNLDWADPANFKVTVPTQVIAEGYYGPGGLIKNVAGGTFSSCENSFKVKYNFSIDGDNYGTFTTVLRR